jgi:hypothetical protein
MADTINDETRPVSRGRDSFVGAYIFAKDVSYNFSAFSISILLAEVV